MRTVNGVVIPDAWANDSTQLGVDAGFEIAHQPQWSTRTYPAAGITKLEFFSTNAAPASEDEGNITFPYSNTIKTMAIGLYFKNLIAVADGTGPTLASAFRDIQILSNKGVLNVQLGKKSYGPFPIWRLCAGGGPWGLIGSTGTAAAPSVVNAAQLGEPNTDAIFKLAVPVVIPAQTQAKIAISWPSALEISDDTPLCLLFDGLECRPKQ